MRRGSFADLPFTKTERRERQLAPVPDGPVTRVGAFLLAHDRDGADCPLHLADHQPTLVLKLRSGGGQRLEALRRLGLRHLVVEAREVRVHLLRQATQKGRSAADGGKNVQVLVRDRLLKQAHPVGGLLHQGADLARHHLARLLLHRTGQVGFKRVDGRGEPGNRAVEALRDSGQLGVGVVVHAEQRRLRCQRRVGKGRFAHLVDAGEVGIGPVEGLDRRRDKGGGFAIRADLGGDGIRVRPARCPHTARRSAGYSRFTGEAATYPAARGFSGCALNLCCIQLRAHYLDAKGEFR